MHGTPLSLLRRRLGALLILALGLALLAGCGFKLRGQSALPFDNAFVQAAPTSMMAGPLRQNLAAQNKLAPSRDTAQVIILLTGEVREKNVLSISGTGKVREYRLVHRVAMAAQDRDGKELLAPSVLQLNRDFSYDDQQVMAKEAEEAMLHREMEQDILRQLLRRLAFLR